MRLTDLHDLPPQYRDQAERQLAHGEATRIERDREGVTFKEPVPRPLPLPKPERVAFTFTIPGQPCAKGRPRFGNGHTYADAKTRSYEALVCIVAGASCAPSYPIGGAVSVTIAAVFDRPKRMSATDATPHLGRPDADNVAKAVLDGMNRAGIWHDDSQVTDLHVTKRYATAGETARVDVRVAPFAEGWK